jgi:hypothetical protein
VGKLFNANEQHILDRYHNIARRFEAIGKDLVYLPHVEDFERRLSRHWHHLKSREVENLARQPVELCTVLAHWPLDRPFSLRPR